MSTTGVRSRGRQRSGLSNQFNSTAKNVLVDSATLATLIRNWILPLSRHHKNRSPRNRHEVVVFRLGSDTVVVNIVEEG
jgi:hypothetical protein